MKVEELKHIVESNNYEIDKYIHVERIYVNKFINSFYRYFITYEEINGEAYLTDKGTTAETLTALDKDFFIVVCNKHNLEFVNGVIRKKFENISDLETFISALDDISAPGHEKYEKALKILHEEFKTTKQGFDKHYIKIDKELTFGTFYSVLFVNYSGEPLLTDWTDTTHYLYKLDIKIFQEVCSKHNVHYKQGTMERKFTTNEDVKIFIKAIDELVAIAEDLEED